MEKNERNERIIIFANSFKGKNKCLAGKEYFGREWIRPVFDKNSGPIPYNRARMLNPHGEFEIKKLSIVDMPLTEKVPLLNQPENYLLGDGKIIQKFKITFRELANYEDKPEILWENNSSTSCGLNDKVDSKRIFNRNLKINQSLYLINIDKLIIKEDLSIYGREKGRKRGIFSYNNQEYNMAITDPFFYREVAQLNTKELILSEPLYICLSLGDVFKDGFCHKLIAGVHYDKFDYSPLS